MPFINEIPYATEIVQSIDSLIIFIKNQLGYSSSNSSNYSYKNNSKGTERHMSDSEAKSMV